MPKFMHFPSLGYKFDGVNGYIQSNAAVSKTAFNLTVTGGLTITNSGGSDYISLDGTGYASVASITGIDSRTVQTFIFKGISFPSFATVQSFKSHNGLCTFSVLTTGQIQVEIQGVGSARISTPIGSPLVAGVEYDIVIRINNALSSGSARVVGDIDIFINGVKQTKGITITGNSTTTSSLLYIGCYNPTTNRTTGKFKTVRVYNTALSDADVTLENAIPANLQSIHASLVAEYKAESYVGTASTPTTIYDVKPFTLYTNVVLVSEFKLGVDSTNSAAAQRLIGVGNAFLHVRRSDNSVIIRFDNAQARQSQYSLGIGDRLRHIAIGNVYVEGGVRKTKLYVDNQTPVDSDNQSGEPTIVHYTKIAVGGSGSLFLNAKQRKSKFYLGKITNVDAQRILDGLEPLGLTLFASYCPKSDEVGSQVNDLSGNGYHAAISGGVTRGAF